MVLTPYSVTDEWRVAPDDQPPTARRCACPEPLVDHDADGWALCLQLGHTDGGALVMERYGHPSVDEAKQRLLGAFEIAAPETGSETGRREAAK